MKNVVLIALMSLGIIGLAAVALPRSAAAIDVIGGSGVCSGSASSSAVCQDYKDEQKSGDNNTNNPIFGKQGVITKAIGILSVIVGFLSVIMIIAASIRMMTAGGDASAVKEARASLFHAIIGLLAAALALTIVGFLLDGLNFL